MERREYKISVTINRRHITKVVIDPHYELKHSSSISDEIILQLVELLDHGVFPVQQTNGAYEYFVTDRIKLNGRFYKLVWLLEEDQLYIGIVNAYRRK